MAKINVATGVQKNMAEALPKGTCWIATKINKSNKPPNVPWQNIIRLKTNDYMSFEKPAFLTIYIGQNRPF